MQGALIGTAGAALVLVVWLVGALNGFEARTWDLRARLLARPGKATSQVATILLDQKSLEWGRKENALSWPWPREVYTAVADFCARGGAKALVLDLFFTEPSVYGVSDDEAIGNAVAKNGRVVVAMNFGSAQATEKSWPADYPRPPIVVSGLGPQGRSEDARLPDGRVPDTRALEERQRACQRGHRPGSI